MQKRFYILLIFAFPFFSSSHSIYKNVSNIDSVAFHLSAFGVESDNFPSIDAYINFDKYSSSCHKWFYNPKYKDSNYSLTKDEIESI
jgi:hypothetical protein